MTIVQLYYKTVRMGIFMSSHGFFQQKSVMGISNKIKTLKSKKK